jgi:hypothetical protein
VPIFEQDRIHLTKVILGNANGQSVQIARGIPSGPLIAVNGGGDGVEEGDLVQPVVTQASQASNRRKQSKENEVNE